METPIKFRNHISIVPERMGRMLVFLAALFFGSLVQNLPDLLEEARSLSEDRNTFLLTLGGILLLFLCFLGYQLLIWAKTWIYVSEGTLVIERRTLNRKVHTIAVRNISNINTEQNLFEMLIGTSKLKLDTNSLSTADKTDVRIVLKTSDAEAFRSYLLSLLHPDQTDPAEGEHGPEHLRPAGPDTYDIHAGLTDICAHGIFSISLLSVLVLAGCVLGTIGTISDTVQNGFSGNGPVGFLVSLLLVLGIFFSALWDILRGFIQYYDFRATRAGDRILIQYGLLKKSSYTIPVDKIQALKLNQSPLARLTGRYMAEIINVGMGDEASERNSFLVLYCKKDILRKRLLKLLPEFSGALDADISRQPRCVWSVWLIPALLFAAAAFASCRILPLFLPVRTLFCVVAAAAAVLFMLLLLILRYYTAGTDLQKDYIVLCNGYFGRHLMMTAYRHIQYIQLEQSPPAKWGHISKGTLYLLASSGNQAQNIPFFSEKKISFLRERLLHPEASSGYTNPIGKK